jgi:hypothetical protein
MRRRCRRLISWITEIWTGAKHTLLTISGAPTHPSTRIMINHAEVASRFRIMIALAQ